MSDFDPKVCPKCVQQNGPTKGADVSVDTTVVTESHRSELNRRPLLVQSGVIFGKSGPFNDIASGLSAKLRRKTDSTRPESVSEVCPAFSRWLTSITNLFRRNRRVSLPRDPFKYGGRDLSPEQFELFTKSIRRDLDLIVYAGVP